MRRIRRRYRSRARGSLPPGAIVGIVAAIVLVAAIITGNVLNSCLDDDTYRRLTEGETDTTEETDAPPRRTSPAVRAYAFRLGSALSSLGSDPPSALALPLNTADGEMLYNSPVVSYLGLSTASNAAGNAERSMSALVERVSYLIGIWQVRLPGDATDAVIYTAAATDAAILREFLSFGGSEILLRGLAFGDSAFDRTYAYLSALRAALGEEIPLSVAVPLSVAEGDSGWDILYALGQQVPFLTLDLSAEADIGTPTGEENGDAATTEDTNASEDPATESPLLRAAFYLSGYRMRLLLSTAQPNLICSAEQTVSDFAIFPGE